MRFDFLCILRGEVTQVGRNRTDLQLNLRLAQMRLVNHDLRNLVQAQEAKLIGCPEKPRLTGFTAEEPRHSQPPQRGRYYPS